MLCSHLGNAYSIVILYAMVRVMVFNATFNNNSVISWWSALMVEKIGVPGEIHQDTDKLYYIMLYRVHLT